MTDENKSTSFESVSDRYCARWSFERLLLMQPHIRVDGLWRKDSIFYAVCPDLDKGLVAEDGQSLEKWFHDCGRAICSPIQLVSVPLDGGIRVPERTAAERAELMGVPLTIRDVNVLLALALPKDFPDFHFDSSPHETSIYVSKNLDQTEEEILRKTCKKILYEREIKIHYKEDLSVESQPFRYDQGTGDIDLIPSRYIRANISNVLREAWEEDEDFWMDNRNKILASNLITSHQLLPHAFNESGSRCLVNSSVFAPKNLRMYLSLYRRVIIVMPLASHCSKVLSNFCITEDDLVELTRKGRLQFALPQSIDRYRIRLLERLVEANPSALLFSRRLAAATVAECRRRIPLLYPPIGTRERRYVLEMLSRIGIDSEIGMLAKSLCADFGRIWSTMEEQISFRGAMATQALGIGSVLACMRKHLIRQDAFIELTTAASSIEWASVLRATVFPIDTDTYSEQQASELCASAFSGIPNEVIPVSFGEVDAVLEGLFALDNDAPILEVEKVFSGTDVDRLGELVRKIAEKKLDKDFLQNAVRDINDKVQKYEGRTDRLRRLDIVTLLGAIAGLISGSSEVKGYLPIGLWLLKYVLKDADPATDLGGRVLDWARGLNAWASGDIVLVSRLRRKFSK